MELLQERRDRYCFFVLTDVALDGEDVFERQCTQFDALARRWGLPLLDDVCGVLSTPRD